MEGKFYDYKTKKNYQPTHISDLIGKTITTIDGLENRSDLVRVECSDGSKYIMSHLNDCFEDVSIEDVNGEPSFLVGSPLTIAEEKTNTPDPSECPEWHTDTRHNVYEWTFYTLATLKGYVDIRWFGASNGFYSTEVMLYKYEGA